MSLVILYCLCFCAGFIDAIVGGGGLIQLPAILICLPDLAPAMALGCNKFASISGTGVALIQYSRRIDLPWRDVLPGVSTAFVFSYFGAATARSLNPAILKPAILVLLIFVSLYTFRNKRFGDTHAPRLTPKRSVALSALAGAALGFYDGFFGPGTGSFLIMIFIGVFGFDFLNASAAAKAINFATNLAALLYFAFHRMVPYEVAAVMALFNISGSWCGSRMAILKGSAFVRKLFMALVCAMILKLALDLIS